MSDRMRTVTVRIPGDWHDAWMYRDHLLLWSKDGRIFRVNIRDVQSAVRRESDAHLALVYDYLVFRNDWKYAEPFTRLAQVDSVRDALFACLDTPNPVVVNISVDHLATPLETDRIPGFLLDSAVYGNRLFTSTEYGLFETVLPSENFGDLDNPLLQVADSRVFNIDTLGGTVIASGGDAGLYQRSITFGNGAEWVRDAERPMTRIDDYSRRASFASYSVLNYKGESSPTLIRTITERRRENDDDQFESTVIDSYKPPTQIVDQVVDSVSARGRGSDFKVIGNSNNQLLVRNSGAYDVVSLFTDRNQATKTKRNPRYRSRAVDAEMANSTLLTHRLRAGFLLEQFDGACILTEKGSYSVVGEPQSRVRTFPRSKFYHDCFAAISPSSVDLVGFIEAQ